MTEMEKAMRELYGGYTPEEVQEMANTLRLRNDELLKLREENREIRATHYHESVVEAMKNKAVENFPSTADVAPVVHGEWDGSGRYTFSDGKTAVRCSECGCALTEGEYLMFNWNFCPVCGAKMDGGDANG